jgi:hypothetical protein
MCDARFAVAAVELENVAQLYNRAVLVTLLQQFESRLEMTLGPFL